MLPPIDHSLRLKPNHSPKEVNQNLRMDKSSLYIKEWTCLLIVSHLLPYYITEVPIWSLTRFGVLSVTSKSQNKKKKTQKTRWDLKNHLLQPSGSDIWMSLQGRRMKTCGGMRAMYFGGTCLLWYSNKEFHQFLALKMHRAATHLKRKISVHLNIQFLDSFLHLVSLAAAASPLYRWSSQLPTAATHTHTHANTHTLSIFSLPLQPLPNYHSAEAVSKTLLWPCRG